MQPNSFDLMYMFAATCGVLFLPIVFGFIAVLIERD